jgi:hypothetical protein
MSVMEPATTSQPPAADPLRTRTGADTDEPRVHRFKSVKMPGVAKGPILPDWVHNWARRLFKRATPSH